MPFEPLNTDEPLGGPHPRKGNLEAQLMSGCMVILVASFITYVLAAWPFFVFPIITINGLWTALAASSVPTWIVGIFLIRRFAHAGITAYVGGIVIASVFMAMRFGQVVLVADSSQLPQLEYPVSYKWLVPVIWGVVSIGIGLIFFPNIGEDNEGS